MKYTDEKDRIIFAGSGLGGDKFMTLYTTNGNGSHRLKSPSLPVRKTLAEAESDLKIYAEKHNFGVISNVADKKYEITVLTQEIISYKNQTAQNFIEIGKRLKLAKETLGHGQWLDWLRDKVEFSPVTAQRFIRIYEEFPNASPATHLPVSKIFELLSLPAEKRDKFIQNNDVKSMSKRQLRQAVKAEKNNKITTTATIETIPNTATSRYLPADTADKIDVQPNKPIIDTSLCSIDLIEGIKNGYTTFEAAANIAKKYPCNPNGQRNAIMDIELKHQQSIAELDEECRPQCALATRWILKNTAKELNIYTALFDTSYYFIGSTEWNYSQGSNNYPKILNSIEPADWDKVYSDEESARFATKRSLANFRIEPDTVNFAVEITPEIAAHIDKSINEKSISLPLEVSLIQEKLITKFKNSKELFLKNYASNKSLTDQKIYAGFYTLLISYLQNVDAYVFKKIMEEENG